MTQAATIPHSRLGRLLKLGGLATSVAGNVISESGRLILSGKRPVLSDLILSRKNAEQVAAKLSEMRGAAMKIGQLLSMDVGYLLPTDVAVIFSRLRDTAHHMSMLQVNEIMREQLGSDWQSHFRRFSFDPIASASIGQVHLAELRSGEKVAVKIQYRGVGESIDSDIDNVMMLLRSFKLVPGDIEIEPLIEDVRNQLHAETDYLTEADNMRRFREIISDDERFEMARIVRDLSSEKILTTTFLEGVPVDQFRDHPGSTRQHLCESLLELALREVFDVGLVQTDGNFANFLFHEPSEKIQLIDFGATRDYTPAIRNSLRQLLIDCLSADRNRVLASAIALGYTTEADRESYQQQVVELLMIVSSPIRHPGDYNFNSSDITRAMSDTLVQLRFEQRYTHLPPTDLLFLHRKLGALYLLLAHLGAELNVNRIVHEQVLDRLTDHP